MRQVLLLLPVIALVLTSGCTSLPGGFCIPGLTCGGTNEETHDVIVIEGLQALPNNVPPSGTIKLVAIISNVADVNAEIKDNIDVEVELYDYCSGLFTVSNPSQKVELLRGEKEQVEWTLTAADKGKIPVKTECDLKLRARYKYSTTSITTLHFIDYDEMQRRINEGTYGEVGSYISVGYGPIKPYVRVEGTQPIPVTNNELSTVLSYQIVNRGKGFLSSASGSGETVIEPGQVVFTPIESNLGDLEDALHDECVTKYFSDNKNQLKLIKGESTKIVCPVEGISVGNVPIESTKTIKAEINGYWYEFRDSIRVTVEPTF